MPAFQVPLVAARMYWIVSGRGEIAPLTEIIRTSVAQVDPGVAVSNARTLETVWLSALGSRRAAVRLLQVFAVVALVLCVMGMYGVAAFAARTRRREFAVRAALGATRRELTTSMLRRELRTVLLGLGLGLGSAFSSGVAPIWIGVETNPRDPLMYHCRRTGVEFRRGVGDLPPDQECRIGEPG